MPKTILIVDDVPTNVGVLFAVLEGAGFAVRMAESGERALESIATAPPDIILLDVLMPGLDGLATCRRLKASPEHRDIPVFFLTALSDVVDKVAGFAAGAVDYITKPLQPEEVLARVNAHLRIRELQAALEQKNLQLEEQNDRLDGAVQQRMAAERALTLSLDRAVIVASAGGEIVFCSEPAAALLARHFPAVAASGRLPAAWPGGATGTPLRVERHAAAGNHGYALFALAEVRPAPSPGELAVLGLTPRETEIVFWIAQGKTNAEVGIILGMSRMTVKKHVENILIRLRVESRLGIALKAVEVLGAK
jgi:DNA-binding response OmpR family regulator/DNA-binding CsgD family transcriptional regulator